MKTEKRQSNKHYNIIRLVEILYDEKKKKNQDGGQKVFEKRTEYKRI